MLEKENVYNVCDSDFLYGLNSVILNDLLNMKDLIHDEEDWHNLNDDIWVGIDG